MEARPCTAQRRDGSPCTGRALPSSREQRCFAHDSDRQDALRASRAAGGRGRSTAARAARHLPSHLRTLQERLIRLVDELGTGAVEPDAARAIVASVGKLLDLARFSLEVGETAALAERLAELERALQELAG